MMVLLAADHTSLDGRYFYSGYFFLPKNRVSRMQVCKILGLVSSISRVENFRYKCEELDG